MIGGVERQGIWEGVRMNEKNGGGLLCNWGGTMGQWDI